MPRRRRETRSRATDVPRLRWLWWLLPLWLALLGTGVWNHRLPGWGVTAIAVLNGLTLLAYAVDKDAARRGRWRIQERTLHLLALLGGWPAAGLAQQVFRHKSSKPAFLRVYAVTAIVHCAALASGVLWRTPALAA